MHVKQNLMYGVYFFLDKQKQKGGNEKKEEEKNGCQPMVKSLHNRDQSLTQNRSLIAASFQT